MNVYLTRYYGDHNVTKSHVRFVDDKGNTLLACEGRELQFVDWRNDEKILGASFLCMPVGEFPLKVTSVSGNPLCYQVVGARAHRSTRICVDLDSVDDRRHDRILLGFGDTNGNFSERGLVKKEQCRDRLYQVILMQSQMCENAVLVVSNEGIRK